MLTGQECILADLLKLVQVRNDGGKDRQKENNQTNVKEVNFVNQNNWL